MNYNLLASIDILTKKVFDHIQPSQPLFRRYSCSISPLDDSDLYCFGCRKRCNTKWPTPTAVSASGAHFESKTYINLDGAEPVVVAGPRSARLGLQRHQLALLDLGAARTAA